jgi:NAD(P)H-hydrate epimerase
VIPAITVAQMREVDRIMVEELGIELIQMMENAGRCLAQHVRSWLGDNVNSRRVAVLTGSGGNGGGGLVAARRLSIWGAEVTVVIGHGAEAIRGMPAHQLGIVERLGIPVLRPGARSAEELERAELIVDALIGYSLQGPPRAAVASLILAANAAAAPTIALDMPSGLDGDTGEPSDPTVRAATTLTLALPKRGLLQPVARDWVGELFVADISVPRFVYRNLGVDVGPLFAASDIVPVPLPEALE